MWFGLLLTLAGPPLLLGLVLVMGYVEDYVEGTAEVPEPEDGAPGLSVPVPGERSARVIPLDRVLPPAQRRPLGDSLPVPLDGTGRPIAR